MLRWTGGSKARATFRQTNPTSGSGSGSGRVHHLSERQPKATLQVRRSQNPSCREGVHVNEWNGMRQSSRGSRFLQLSEDSGEQSPPLPTGDRRHVLPYFSSRRRGGGGDSGVDCMALEWSLKAAAAAAVTTTTTEGEEEALQRREAAPRNTHVDSVTDASPAHGGTVTLFKVGSDTLVQDEGMYPSSGCWCRHADSEYAAATPGESSGMGLLFEEGHTPQAADPWMESQCARPFLVSALGDAIMPISDNTAQSTQMSLWQPSGLVGEHQRHQHEQQGWRMEAAEYCGSSSQPRWWDETHPHDHLDGCSYRRTPFASPSPAPDAHQACAWHLDDPVAVSAYDGFQMRLFDDDGEEEGDECAGKAAAHAAATLGAAEIGVGPCGYYDRRKESARQRHDEVFYDPSVSYAPLVEDFPPPPRAPASGLALTSLLRGHPRERVAAYAFSTETTTPYNDAFYDEHQMWLGTSVSPQRARDPPPYSASRGVASRGRRGRGGGGGRRRGYGFNLSGDVLSARYHAFQRRCRHG